MRVEILENLQVEGLLGSAIASRIADYPAPDRLMKNLHHALHGRGLPFSFRAWEGD